MNPNGAMSSTVAPSPLTLTVDAWDQYRVTPGTKHYLSVTLTNRGSQDAVVQVRLESVSDLLQEWCAQPEQWLALTSGNSGELIFCIDVPADAMPQWFDYDVVVRPQAAYAEYYLAPTRCRLQILAPDVSESTQDPTFFFSPVTSPDRPLIVQPGLPTTVELQVENRSERVDRFRVECTGLPSDWTIQVEYPSEYGGLGLVQLEESLGVNPGDRGTIRVLLQPPILALAGSYLPTIQLLSENDATLGLLALVYLQINPVYQLQAQLQTLNDQVRGGNRPAQFLLQFSNQGNTPRQVQISLQPLTPPEHCRYVLASQAVTIGPQSTAQLPLEGHPQRWWTRPWFGAGKLYPFRLDLADSNRQPIIPETLQGYFTWMPRPWWQLLLVVLAGLGVIGALAFLIWWNFFRPPTPPKVLEFAAEDSRYAEVNGDMARVRWQIEQPQRIQSLKLTGYSPEGEVLSGPLVYEFAGGRLPAALQPFCTLQKALLTCSQIRTDAFRPGKYVFELTLTSKGRRSPPLSLKSAPVEIVAKPLPTVTTLLPRSLVYREAAPGTPTPAEKALPVADAAGVRLDWVVTMPREIAALHLIGRDKEGKLVGDRWYEFPASGELPEALRPFCRIEQTLVCRNVATGLRTAGEYRLELEAVPAAAKPPEAKDAKPKATELIKIQPQTPQILNFQINGQEAPAKLVIPVRPGQLPPVIQVSWRVQGGTTTQVALTPAPGNVPLVGKVRFPLSPQGGSTIALQVKTPAGDVLTRAVTLETYAPAPPTGGDSTGATGSPASPGSATPAPATSGSPAAAPAFGAPAPTVNDRVSPSEQPPQFSEGG